MSAVAVGACNFMKMDVEFVQTTSYDFGLFSHGKDGYCSKYSSEVLKQLSSNYKAAQAFGVLGALFGGFLMIACFMMLFFTFPRGVCIFISWLFVHNSSCLFFFNRNCFALTIITTRSSDSNAGFQEYWNVLHCMLSLPNAHSSYAQRK